jgi:hypothetical protein
MAHCVTHLTLVPQGFHEVTEGCLAAPFKIWPVKD